MLKEKATKKLIARIILIILIIINCLVIFKFSSEKSEQSNNTSGVVVEKIVETNPNYKKLDKEQKEIKKQQLVTPVRKTAHFTVYTILGMLLYLCSKTFEGKEKARVIISLSLAFLYACTDEVHQHFVPGRSGEFRDVCIDTSGALFGIIIIAIIFYFTKIKIYENIIRAKKNEESKKKQNKKKDWKILKNERKSDKKVESYIKMLYNKRKFFKKIRGCSG